MASKKWVRVETIRQCKYHGPHDNWAYRPNKGYDCRKCSNEKSIEIHKRKMNEDSIYKELFLAKERVRAKNNRLKTKKQ